MMRFFRLPFAGIAFALFGLPTAGLAQGGFAVEGAEVGRKTLTLSLEDTVRPPDLSKLQVSGHQIQAAAFIEESDLEFVASPNLVDAAGDPALKVLREVRPGLIEFEGPDGFLPREDMVLSDTALGGLLVKVQRFEAVPGSGGLRRRWLLEVVPAALTDAIFSCDIFFSTDINLNLAFRDQRGSREIQGPETSGHSESAWLKYALSEARVLARPRITGRIRIKDGRVEVFSSTVQGDFEFLGSIEGSLRGVGAFRLEEALPEAIAVNIPLGRGLFARISHNANLIIDATSRTGEIKGRAGMNLRSRVRGSLDYKNGEWHPTSDNTLVPYSKTRQEVEGEGTLKLTLQSNLKVRLNGRHGPVHVFEPFLRLSSETLPSVGIAQPTAPGSSVPWTERALNRYVNIGLHFHMLLGANLEGAPVKRNFQVFTREIPHLAPPVKGTLSVYSTDTAHAVLAYRGPPGADRFRIQMWDGLEWQDWFEAPGPRLRLPELTPGTAYKVRVLGINAMGIGEPFPAEGLGFTTLHRNRPPLTPQPVFPSPDSVTRGLEIDLAWKGGDPDGDIVTYDIFLDTLNPPDRILRKGLDDTAFQLSGLLPGKRYYWSVKAGDGRLVTESPVWNFSTAGISAIAETGPRAPSDPGDRIFIHGGKFLRKDGKRVSVREFYLQKYEVSQGDFKKVMGHNPSHHLHDSLPVEKVLWDEAAQYCGELGGRLPTEAEWEYAARAGTGRENFWGGRNPGRYAWYFANSEQRTRPVGSKQPNPWGVHDVMGNVSEWVRDWYGEYSPDQLDNPTGPESGTAKVVRGASWYSEPESLGPSVRFNNRPGFRNYKIGFRCAWDADSDARLSSTGD